MSSDGKVEAERWLGIAEKLLVARDFHGSRTFANRARESDPRLDGSDRILAVSETLIAGESRINSQHDWYSILQISPHAADHGLVSSQYARLGSLLTPSINTLPFSHEVFKLVSDAFSVLSNPTKKAHYDEHLGIFSQPASNFWTTCPYCYNLYEYPAPYQDCTLRCRNCRRAFQALSIPAPPVSQSEKNSYFCSWAFFPIGVDITRWETASSWTPFSAIFACPAPGDRKTPDHEAGTSSHVPEDKKTTGTRNSRRVVVDVEDDDVYMDAGELDEDSEDVDWDGNSRKKRIRRGSGGKGSLKGRKGNLESARDEPRSSGRVTKELGKLDLNVEFSNEAEENGVGRNGEEDGTGFFEGLDEFLSNLPIITVVADEKVKAAP